MAPTFAGLAPEYARLRATARVTAKAGVDAAVKTVSAGRARYEEIEVQTGVPWWFIGALHYRESTCDFRGVLHNGERILGTGRKTSLVPKGRGPFSTWEEAAVDALRLKGLHTVTDWSLERALYEGERFNGFCYRNRGVPSAYLWSGTSVYAGGKYVADGKWSATARDKQMGIAPIMFALAPADVVQGNATPDALPVPTPAPARPGAPDAEQARQIQERLRALGYAEAGLPNGEWGTRSIAALTAFQVQEGLPQTGEPDDTTLNRLFDTRTAARPVSPDRAAATVKKLRPTSQTLQATLSSKVGAGILGIGGMIAAAVQGVGAFFGSASDMLRPLREYLDWVPGEVWALAVAGMAYVIWRSNTKAEQARVAAFRDGTDAGPA